MLIDSIITDGVNPPSMCVVLLMKFPCIMNRITAYQNASAIMAYLIGTGVGTIISLDVFPLYVQLHIHLPRKTFVVDDVRKKITPFLIGSPKIGVSPIDSANVDVLHVEWDDFDQ